MTYQAITTKYIPASNTKGSRIKASAYAGSIFFDYAHELNAEENHAEAAQKLARKMGWNGRWFGGGLPDDAGYCFVCTDTDTSPAFTLYFAEKQ